MTTQTNQQLGRRTIHVCLAITLLSLVPHLAQSFDSTTGLRVGTLASSNDPSNDAMMVGEGNYNPSPNAAAIGSYNDLGGPSFGDGSIAAGEWNWLYGPITFAFGEYNFVMGRDALALGTFHYVVGDRSFAYGDGCQTSSYAPNSLAGGSHAIAQGQNAVAFGDSTTAYSQSSVVIGRWNKPVGDENIGTTPTNTWRNTDSLFVIGNGSSTTNRSNAMVVTKDGTVTIGKVPAQGGISMGGYE